MLLRERQIRRQVHQWTDGGIFALGLWLGHAIRHAIGHGVHKPWLTIRPDKIADFYPEYFWLFLVVIPMAPLVLEWQGFYDKQGFTRHKEWVWQLGRACAICAMALIFFEVMLRQPEVARSVFVFF